MKLIGPKIQVYSPLDCLLEGNSSPLIAQGRENGKYLRLEFDLSKDIHSLAGFIARFPAWISDSFHRAAFEDKQRGPAYNRAAYEMSKEGLFDPLLPYRLAVHCQQHSKGIDQFSSRDLPEFEAFRVDQIAELGIDGSIVGKQQDDRYKKLQVALAGIIDLPNLPDYSQIIKHVAA